MISTSVFAPLLFLGFASATCPKACEPATKYLTVNTSNGPITGHIANGSQCVIEYLGIPFAKPPVGELRFAAPQRSVANDTYDASQFGFDCPLTASKPINYPGFTPQAQRIMDFFSSGAGTTQSEDCLTLNIWTKPPTANAPNEANKPILVYFYGGRFTVGNTNTPFLNGKYFASAEDVVVVTANYRLNIFGFPGAPGETQNLGLRDQRAAVEWVRENIANFGGDSSKIIISGQSSGGAAVDYWAYAYPQDPIAHGIIAHSGTVFSFLANTKSVQETNWNTVVAAVNCSSTNDTMSCMRKADWRAIKAAAAAIKAAKSITVLRPIPPFWPTPDDVIIFSPSEYVSMSADGSFARLPILFGNTHNENGYYQVTSFANGIIPTEEQIRDFMLECFTCPVSYQVSARREHGVVSYAYRYFADWDNTRLFNGSGAYHGVDVHMIFGASEDVSGLLTTAEQRKLTKLMQRAWFAFAKDPVSGLVDELGWPRFDSKAESLVQLGLGNVAEARFAYPSVYDAPCSTVVMGALGTPPV
ncbi:cholinesterase precursor [Podospora didyma]|uniref:Carboxylic ester hydrolase n=1 Tax=Podospora didyma TaxID=330526 RepID=A0AAE0U3R4_9PEZI|nr:cholinesterase precursor [Podospora didyma]